MQKVTAKVTSKEIVLLHGTRSADVYYLTIKLINDPTRYGLELGKDYNSFKDTSVPKIEVGKIYTFYIDPSFMTRNNRNYGVRKIYDGETLIIADKNKRNLGKGVLAIILSIAGAAFTKWYTKHEKSLTTNHPKNKK